MKRKLGDVSPKAAGGGRRSTITLQDIERGLVACPDATAIELTVEINRSRTLEEGADSRLEYEASARSPWLGPQATFSLI